MPSPSRQPPILLDLDYATLQPALPEEVREFARYEGDTLRISSGVPDGNTGFPAAELQFGDVIVQAELSLSQGGDDDLYGMYLRSPSADLYCMFVVSPSGQVSIGSYEGEFVPLVSGPLDPDMEFGYGLQQPNRFQVVAVGPSLTFMLNGMLVTAEIVDERYQQGYLGFFLHHGVTSPAAEMSVHWIQVRGVFPPG